MKFRFIEEHRSDFPTNRLCDVVGVSMRGLRAFRSRPASRRQRSDLVTLAHIPYMLDTLFYFSFPFPFVFPFVTFFISLSTKYSIVFDSDN